MPLTSRLIRWIKSSSRSRFLRRFHLFVLLLPPKPESQCGICFVMNAEAGITIGPLFESLPMPALRFASSVSIIHKQSIRWHGFSHFLSQEFQEARRILNRSFDSCVGQAGHLSQSDGSAQPPMVMNSIYERCAGEWWARCVFISQSLRAGMRLSRRRPPRYLVLIYILSSAAHLFADCLFIS